MGRQESACPQPAQCVSQVVTVHCIGHLKPFLPQESAQENLHGVPAGIEMEALGWELLSAFLITAEKGGSRKERQLFCAVRI